MLFACRKIDQTSDHVDVRCRFVFTTMNRLAINPGIVRVSVLAVTRAARLFGKRTPCVTTRVRVLLAEHTYSRGPLGFAGNLLPPYAVQR